VQQKKLHLLLLLKWAITAVFLSFSVLGLVLLWKEYRKRLLLKDSFHGTARGGAQDTAERIYRIGVNFYRNDTQTDSWKLKDEFYTDSQNRLKSSLE